MCRNCTRTAVENIADIVIQGYTLELATRLYRDSVLQCYLMDTPDDGKSPEYVLEEARDLSRIIGDASRALELAQREKPEAYESLLQVRTLLSMLKGD